MLTLTKEMENLYFKVGLNYKYLKIDLNNSFNLNHLY